MSITVTEFEKHKTILNKKQAIYNFLEMNKTQAFKAVEIAKEMKISLEITAAYLYALKREGKVRHKRPYWIHTKNKIADNTPRKIPKINILHVDEKRLWKKVLKLKGSVLAPAANRHKKQEFTITEATDNYIKIKFLDSLASLKVEKLRVALAFSYLKMNKGKWVRIGASRINTDPNSIEGVIKLGIDGKLNGLSTATWVAAILLKCEPRVIFNGKLRNQALMYK